MRLPVSKELRAPYSPVNAERCPGGQSDERLSLKRKTVWLYCIRMMNRFCVGFMVTLALLLAGRCAKNPEPIVRQRAQVFTQLLTTDKFEKAVAYFDPDIVVRSGRVGLTDAFKSIMSAAKSINQAAGRQAAGFEFRTVSFFADKTQASVHLLFFATDASGADRRSFPTDQKWVLKQNIWGFGTTSCCYDPSAGYDYQWSGD